MRSGCEHVYMYLPVDVTINKKNPTCRIIVHGNIQQEN